ncbi:MAG TPA: hypothetical protein VEY67_09460 [Candidatus Dormibacteraeota bacterium]|nr:hypothetical protein [Candidatus Dormibacteraeota bacterium]
MTHDHVAAVGGEWSVPAPDPIARDYLRLALRLDQHDPGIVDAYVGPADLKAEVDLERVPPLGRLREDAASLRARVTTEVADPDRRAWLDAQLIALETRAAVLAGERVPYLEQVERAHQLRPRRRDDAIFDASAAELSGLLPGAGPLDERLEAWDDRVVVDPERLPAVLDWLIAELRARAASRFGLPEGESLRVGLVRGQTWSGYCWFDGLRRSRIDLNIDLPIRAPELVATLGHETYAGHHLEHAWKEETLVEGAARLEASVLLLPTPESVVSEGLAEVGPSLLLPDAERVELLAELFGRAGLELAGAGGPRAAAEASVAIAPLRRRLGESIVNAALLRHVDGASSEETLAYLRRAGRYPEARARQRLGFLEDPRWRTYVFVYDEGRELLERWVELGGPDERDARFGRLLRESLTPAGLEREVAGATSAA